MKMRFVCHLLLAFNCHRPHRFQLLYCKKTGLVLSTDPSSVTSTQL
jgi:hypothetical protein